MMREDRMMMMIIWSEQRKQMISVGNVVGSLPWPDCSSESDWIHRQTKQIFYTHVSLHFSVVCFDWIGKRI